MYYFYFIIYLKLIFLFYFQLWIFPKGNAFDPNLQVPVSSVRRSVTFWGIICCTGPLFFIQVDGNMTGDKYIDILSEHLLPLLEDTGLKETFLFQQDNAPWHTSGAVNEFLVESELKVFDWPAYSPDLNIIENVWKYVKHYVR